MKQLTELATPFASVAESSELPGQELAWLQTLRQRALTQFSEVGLPAKKHEDWKYTSLWSLSQHPFTHQAGASSVDAAQVEGLALLDDAYRLVIVDGQYMAALSQLDNLPAGVTVLPFSASLASLANCAVAADFALNAANLSSLFSGFLIEVFGAGLGCGEGL